MERCEDWLQPCKAPVERPSLGVRCGMFELIILLLQGSKFCVGILSSGLVARFELGPRSSEAGWDIYPVERCQFHSNCASVCFELQLGCCYGAISLYSLYNIKETANCTAQEHLKSDVQAGASSLTWKVVLSKLMLLVLVFSMKHWKNTVFSFLSCILLWYYCCVNFAQSPPWHRRMVWTVCICLYCCHMSLVKSNVFGRSETFGKTEVDFRLFSRQRHTISRTFEVSESESDFAHFWIWSMWLGWHIDTLILKAYWSGYGMNGDFSLKLPIEGSESL